MFKSVFAKYVITFAALLLVSFLLLLFLVNSVVTNHTIRNEQNNIRGVATSCADNLAQMYAQSDLEGFDDFIKEPSGESIGVERVLHAILTNFEDMTVYVTDDGGGFLFSTGKFSHTAPAVGTQILSPENLSALPSLSPRRETSVEEETLPDGMGVFLTEHSLLSSTQSFLFVLPIVAEEHSAGSLPIGYLPIGYVVVTSTAETQGNMMNATFRSMVVAALWIMLAALIAIYFITERVISPLREMSRAAKRMAVGRFDVRVPVHGRDEVAELAVAFNQMSQALENLERMRNSFVANVSHDLRTPMTTISGFIDGILDGVIPPDQQSHYLRVVSTEVRRLSRLVTALLDVSRLQAGDRKFDMKPFDVCEMGRQILISFEQKIEDKSLDVEFLCEEERMFVLADSDAIHQILYNICDNAIKFSCEGGKLRMEFAWSGGESTRHRKAVVKVFNEGQGIPEEDLPFVFERFYKSDKSRGLDKSGVGLGMFIAKTIIEAHGETISVASDYGHTCEFTFTLARTEPPASKGRLGHTQGGNP